VAMVKLFWLCVLIVLSITAFLVSDSMAILQFPIGARRHGKVQVILKHVYPLVRSEQELKINCP